MEKKKVNILRIQSDIIYLFVRKQAINEHPIHRETLIKRKAAENANPQTYFPY